MRLTPTLRGLIAAFGQKYSSARLARLCPKAKIARPFKVKVGSLTNWFLGKLLSTLCQTVPQL